MNHWLARLRRTAAILLLAGCAASSISLPANSNSNLQTIQNKIAQCLKRPGMRSASWGIEVFDTEANQVVLAVNPDKTFLPASVIKLVTTATCLEKLGPDFRFLTGVYTNGSLLPDGTLQGDLILVGRGDPNLLDPAKEMLSESALKELARKIQSLGIRTIRGNVIGDDSYFEYKAPGKSKAEREQPSLVGAPINALNINNNMLSVHVRATRSDQLVQVGLDPQSSYFQTRNLAITGGAHVRRTISASLIPGSRRLVISGVLPAGQTFDRDLMLDRPAEVTATVFKDELRRAGLSITGSVAAIHQGEVSPEARRRWRLLAEHQSPPLVRALEIVNKRSLNLQAEIMLRVLGAEFGGAGVDEAGLRVARDFVVSAGIEDGDKISLRDGSGLSRANLITPRFQTSLLTFLATRPYFDLFLNTLAISGTDGTLRYRLSSTPGVIHAKTGTLDNVAALSGYMKTKSGRNLIFSIFANNVRASSDLARRTIDEICALFVNLY